MSVRVVDVGLAIEGS